MKKLQLTIKSISFFLLISGIVFSSCSKKDAIPEVATPSDLTVNFVGAYTGPYTSAVGAVSLTQKLKVTKISNNQIKVENNGGPISVATSTFTLSISASSGGNVGGIATDGSTIGQSATGLTITYVDGAAYVGSR